jgi:hypothetical protein
MISLLFTARPRWRETVYFALPPTSVETFMNRKNP